MTTITAVHNISSGSYNVSFSTNVVTWAFGYEQNILMFSPGGDGWAPVTVLANPAANILTIEPSSGDDDCTLLIVAAAPTTFTVSPPLQVASPVPTVT